VSTIPSSFYFFSTEGPAKGLPVRAQYVKSLKAHPNTEREAILIACEHHVDGYPSAYLALVPKLQNTSFASLSGSEAVVFAYVLDGKDLVETAGIDLSSGSQLVLDIGGIANDIEVARMWQGSQRGASSRGKKG
jgi:hypothetical protein